MSNLFINQTESFHEQYKLAEIDFERLLERFNSDPAAFLLEDNLEPEPFIIRDKIEITNLSERLSKFTNQNEKLRSELDAAEPELDRLRDKRQPPKSPIPKKRKLDSGSNASQDKSAEITRLRAILKSLPDRLSKPIDTAKFGQELISILKTNHISQRLFAQEVVGLHEVDVRLKLTSPKPWSDCTTYAKRFYQRMFEWFKSTNGIETLKALGDLLAFSYERANNQGLPDLPDSALDTVQVSTRIRDILKSRNISVELFGRKVIESPNGVWRQRLLDNPKPWSELTAFTKRVFVKMNNWSNCEESIRSLEALAKVKVKREPFSYSKSLPEVKSNVKLNTEVVAQKLSGVLKSKSIDFKFFLKHVVKINYCHFIQLLKKPVPWSQCTQHLKKVYFRMNQWSDSTNEIRSLAELNESEGKFSRLSSTKNLPEVPFDLKLDTVKVARALDGILQDECITRKFFSTHVVKTETTYFAKLLNHPIAWSECNGHKKKLYLRAHEWCQSSDEIRSLKELQQDMA